MNMARLPADIIPLQCCSIQGRQQLSVLLVEDSVFQQVLIAHMLKQLGHEVSVANDGFEALSAIQLNRCYDVILMDCRMPLMDGFLATKFIREAEQITGQRIAIIGISADTSPEACFVAGMDDFLSKPLNKLILKATLGRWIRKKYLGRDARLLEVD
jgi:CheY-like chemotaxis protein